jgi:hypothetical protein
VAGTLGPVFLVGNLNQSHLVIFILFKRRKIQNTIFYEYVKRTYSYADDDCICRRCDMRLHNAMKQDKEAPKGPVKNNQS